MRDADGRRFGDQAAADRGRLELGWADALARDVEGVVASAVQVPIAVFVAALPKTRSAKIMRRAVRAKALGADPGDLSSLENPEALEEIERAVA